VGGSSGRVAVRTLGCKVNRSESEGLVERLLGRGFEVVPDEAAADLVVVNTCTVTSEADAKARKEVRRALAACGGPVVVTGCLAALDGDGLRALGPRVVVQAARAALETDVARLLGSSQAAAASLHVMPSRRPAGALRTRVMVKVQDGCDRRCAYCIVPDARGGPRSVPAREVLDRVASLVASGTSEVVLTGINIGRYADGAAGVEDLATLVRRVADAGVARVRISSIEPPDLTDRFVDALRSVPQAAPHLHVPLQSGCDRTLSEMGRRYTAAEFAGALARCRGALPDLAITTDVMVGFPGETDADFEESLEFAEACDFAKLHVFRYSARAGTPAARRSDQVAPRVKAARAARMRALSDRLAAARAAVRAGGKATVLVERVGAGAARGTTEDGLHVALRGARDVAVGALVPVTLRLDANGCLVGEVGAATGGLDRPSVSDRAGTM
jgi:threonylcarbamoyladenosine tRNA methylthiotransferase MtaB